METLRQTSEFHIPSDLGMPWDHVKRWQLFMSKLLTPLMNWWLLFCCFDELMSKFRHTVYWNLTLISDDGKWGNNVCICLPLLNTSGIIIPAPRNLCLVGLAAFCITCVFFICSAFIHEAYAVCCQMSKDGFFICLCFAYLLVFQSTAISCPPYKRLGNGLKLWL